MKTLKLLIALMICGVSQAQVTMHIHYSNGTTLDIQGADIDSVYFPLDPMNHAVYLTNDDVQSDAMMLIDSVTFSGVPIVPMSCFDGILNNGEDYPDCGGPCPPCGTCDDGIQNEVWVPQYNDFFMEQGVDCGFPCPSPCVPSCEDGIQNGNEEGIDCGGSCPDPCPPPLCNDGVWNGLETGVDCGGPDCLPCPTPSCNDGIQNQNETGIDCGGVCPDECPDPTCFDGIQNQGEEGIDCGGPCPVMCPPPSCNDGVQNQGEEWIDCGGPCPNECPTCDDGVQNGPEAGNDCVIGGYPNYSGGMCPQCPTCYDNIINNFETYIDCGGPNCAPCEMYLNAENLCFGPFIGDNFEVTLQGFDIVFSASQTDGDQTCTLEIKIPMGMEAMETEPMNNWFASPSALFIDFDGTVYESTDAVNSEMTITYKTTGNDPDHLAGQINMVYFVELFPGEGTAEVSNISFFLNY